MTPTPERAAETTAAGEPPLKIYLQWDGDVDEPDRTTPYEKRGEISWRADKVWEHDVEYVRADRLPEIQAALEAAIEFANNGGESRPGGAKVIAAQLTATLAILKEGK